jgi:hypothetical protein
MLSSITTYLGPLVSAAVGWILHEMSDTIKVRREDRRAVGKVLAELLEIRHQWRSIPTYFAEIRRLIALPPEVVAVISSAVNQILAPMLSKMEERYNEAIDSIKGSLPILAFELRGKDALRSTFDQLRSLAASDAAAIAALPTVEFTLTQEAMPLLEELLLKLAWIHGLGTWIKVRRRLRKKEDTQSDAGKIMEAVFKALGMPFPPTTPPSS